MKRLKGPRPGFRLCALAAVSAGLLFASIAASGTALAGGGNSANAKKCQKNGWQTLVTSTGATFASEEECTSYGAQGGVLYPLSAAPCLNGGWQTPAQRSDGTPFSSQSDCTTYTSTGGVVYKPSLTAVPSEVVEEQNIALIASGFHPNSTGALTIVVLPSMVTSTLTAVTNATGGFTGSDVFTSGACALGDTGALFTYVDGSGVHASATATLDCP
jgi:hypothetical protein